MNEKGKGNPWTLFIMVIGMLFIMGAPNSGVPALMISEGLVIVLVGVILWRRSRRKNRR